ncbi:MAG: serine hydrolase [Cytophagales bacterium]|nr:serine hydrolase [Cytophagales bacterium]
MKKKPNLKSFIATLIIALLVPSCAQESTSSKSQELIEKVATGLTTPVYIDGDATWSIEERMEHYGVPGVSIAVIHKGEIAWAKGFGVMDKESQAPVTSETLFQASALSIPVSAYGAIRMVEQGKVELDENINSYLKSWKVPESEFTKEKKATIRNILNHSAGITLHATPGYSSSTPRPTLIEVLSGTSPAINEPIAIKREPDVSYYISYTGYGIIQQMMVDVEGRAFPGIMDDLVLAPLAMTNSTFSLELSQEQLARAATAYEQDGAMVEGKRFVHPVSAGRGLWTTPTDLAKFLIHVQQTLKGKRDHGLSQEMTRTMVTPHSVSSYGNGLDYGLGFQLVNKKEVYLRHWGWNRGYYSEFMVNREGDYGVVVMTNNTFPAFNAEVIRAVARTYGWDDYVPEHTKVPIDQTLADEITGRYQASNSIVEVYQENDQLFFKNILDVNAQELIKVSDNLFARRTANRLIQFNPGTENETATLVSKDRYDESFATTLVKKDQGDKSPVEYLLDGDLDGALEAYSTLQDADPDHPMIEEEYIDDIGFDFYHSDRKKLAQNTFKVNTMLYPESSRVYHSYARACKDLGDTDLAIENFSKSLELNPENNLAAHELEELRKGE